MITGSLVLSNGCVGLASADRVLAALDSLEIAVFNPDDDPMVVN